MFLYPAVKALKNLSSVRFKLEWASVIIFESL